MCWMIWTFFLVQVILTYFIENKQPESDGEELRDMEMGPIGEIHIQYFREFYISRIPNVLVNIK